MVGIFISIRAALKLVAAGVLAVSLSACLTQPSNEGAQNPDGNPGDGVSVRPMFLCGEGRAVSAVGADGSVRCAAPVLKGMAAKAPASGKASCAHGQILEWLAAGEDGDADGPLMLPICNEPDNTNDDSVTLGAGPANEFSCPPGSALKGFSDKGEPICASLVGKELLHAALIMEPKDCPWGMLSGDLEHEHFRVPICMSDGRAPAQLRLNGQYATRTPSQNGRLCNGDQVVVGFTEDHDLICAESATGFRKSPTRYWTTKFDGHAERPVCATGYHSVPVLLKRASGKGALIKVWTCSRSV